MLHFMVHHHWSAFSHTFPPTWPLCGYKKYPPSVAMPAIMPTSPEIPRLGHALDAPMVLEDWPKLAHFWGKNVEVNMIKYDPENGWKWVNISAAWSILLCTKIRCLFRFWPGENMRTLSENPTDSKPKSPGTSHGSEQWAPRRCLAGTSIDILVHEKSSSMPS